MNHTDFFNFIQEYKISLKRVDANTDTLFWILRDTNGHTHEDYLFSVVEKNFYTKSCGIGKKEDLLRFYYLFAHHGFKYDKNEEVFVTNMFGSNSAIKNESIRGLIDDMIEIELKESENASQNR